MPLMLFLPSEYFYLKASMVSLRDTGCFKKMFMENGGLRSLLDFHPSARMEQKNVSCLINIHEAGGLVIRWKCI